MPSLDPGGGGREVKENRIFLYISAILVALIIMSGVGTYAYKAGSKNVSEDLLQAFYTFDLNTISENDKRISQLATEEIYERYTISSSNRQLRVYLKFEGKPTEAKIISHKNGIIYYYIESENFDPDRTFALRYNYSWGKITDIVEYEIFVLPQSLRSDLE